MYTTATPTYVTVCLPVVPTSIPGSTATTPASVTVCQPASLAVPEVSRQSTQPEVSTTDTSNVNTSGSTVTQAVSPVKHSRPPATVKLEKYDRSTPLETYIAIFENCARYYKWEKEECICHLQSTLDGSASQLLWGVSPNITEEMFRQFKIKSNLFVTQYTVVMGSSHRLAYCTIFIITSSEVVDLHICICTVGYLYQLLFVPVYT